jgi:hypothetical protein
VKRQDRTYLLAFRKAPDWSGSFGKNIHIDPSSVAASMTSADGLVWDASEQRILYDHYLYGVQDPCLNRLDNGSLLCTFFMWKVADAEPGLQGRDVYGKWIATLDKTYAIRSSDGGATWDEPTVLGEGALRGNGVQLPNGTILVASYILADWGDAGLAIHASDDGGHSWKRIAHIPNPDDCVMVEPTLFRTQSGKIVCFARSTRAGGHPLMICESYDEGVTWSRPAASSIDTLNPFHLLQLSDGNVLLSYGYRRKPYGIRARVLNAECTNTEEAEVIVLREDGAGPDLGYSSAVQLEDGRILIAYYFYDTVRGPRYIAGTVCEYR